VPDRTPIYGNMCSKLYATPEVEYEMF